MPLFGRRKKKESGDVEPDGVDDLGGADGSGDPDGAPAEAASSLNFTAPSSGPSPSVLGTEGSDEQRGPLSTFGGLRSLMGQGMGGGGTVPASAGRRAEHGYGRVRVLPGVEGWGRGFVVEPRPDRHLVCSVTGGGIHPVAQRIAELTGGTAVDGFGATVHFDEMACAVIDCGGTARIGVYPMKGVLTIDIHAKQPSGPLARFITEDNFVSGVTPAEVELAD